MRYCPSCEIRLPDHAHFCSHCGYALETTIVVKRAVDKRQLPLAGLQTHVGSTTSYQKVLSGETVMQNCPSCETEQAHNAHFCTHCGLALSTTTTIDDPTNMRPPSVYVEPGDISTTSHSASTSSQKVLGRLPM